MSSTTEVRTRGGKYLTFASGKEGYGLEILKVREIIGFMDITAVPRMPSHVRGVINLRGQVISVINLAPNSPWTPRPTRRASSSSISIKADAS